MHQKKHIRKFTGLYAGVITLSALILAACGGSSNNNNNTTPPAPLTFTGTAAVGDPIVGATVTISCGIAVRPSNLSSPVVTGTATTDSNGNYTVSVVNAKLPCFALLTGGTIDSAPNTATYTSVGAATGVMNITSITHLLTHVLAPQALSTHANSLSDIVSTDSVTTALNTIKSNLPALNGIPHPITDSFSATSPNPAENALLAFGTSISGAGISTELLAAAVNAANSSVGSAISQNLNTAIDNECDGACGITPPMPPMPPNPPYPPI